MSEALRLRPAPVDAVREAQAAFAAGDLNAAAVLFDQAAKDFPQDFEARYGLASVLIAAGADDAARSVLADANALHGVAVIRELGADMARFKTDRAYAAQLANELYARRSMGPASVAFGRALDVAALDPTLLLSYGLSLQHQGRVVEAAEVFAAGVEAFANPVMHEFLLFCLFFVPDGVHRYAAEARRWAQLHTAGLEPAQVTHSNERRADRRLRVGYIGPSFTRSQLNQFVMPALENHDPEAVDLHIYCADPTAEDALPPRAKVTGIAGLSDEALAAQVRTDRIDILVDLWGHTAGSRMGVFARRPAPVQVAWVNFVQTTGLSAMDYVLHCDSMDAPGTAELFTETIWRTGEIIAPYRPAPDRPEPAPTPALAAGHVTYGSFNNPMKLSAETVEAWSRILVATPGSKLVLKYGPFIDPVLQRTVRARFAAHGVDPERLVFRGHSAGPDYLREFQDIDLALDPSPCPGGTTTCDALANGVPVLTLAGPDFYSRIGLNTVITCGLPELIAEDWDAYVDKAVALGSDIAALDGLRARVRPGFEASAFRDEAGFTRRLEAGYREMFGRWLAK